MLMATHDLRLAANIAHRVVLLEGGSIVESASAQTIFTQAKQARTREFVATLNHQQLNDWEI